MKPRDLLLSRLEKVIEHMEVIGFVFSPSQLKFSRKIDNFTQRVSFSLSKWNTQDNCVFWTMWGVSSSDYPKWYKNNFGIKPDNNALGGSSDWNIPDWTRGVSEHFVLRNKKEDTIEINSLLSNIDNAGIPYVNSISNWKGAAKKLVFERWMYDKAADFMLIANEAEKAKQILLSGIANYEEDGRPDCLNELPNIRNRLKMFFEL